MNTSAGDVHNPKIIHKTMLQHLKSDIAELETAELDILTFRMLSIGLTIFLILEPLM